MRKVWAVARREYFANVRTKAFIVSLLLMPIFMGGGLVAQRLLEGRVDLEDQHVVVVDATGWLYPALLTASERRNREELRDRRTGRQTEARYLIEFGPTGPLTEAARLALSEAVRRRRIHAFVEIDPGVAAVRFYSESVLSSGLNRWLSRVITESVHERRLREAGMDPAVIARATAPVRVQALGLYSRAANGAIKKADEGSRRTALFLPLGVIFLMFIVLMMAQTMLHGTLEEKQQRIAEVLLGSIRPFPLMLGKLLGSVGVSLTTVTVYLAGGWWLLHHMGYAELLRSALVIWFLVYMVLGVLIFGSVFIAIGAACNDLKDAQNLLMPALLALILPLMIFGRVLEEPMSAFATAVSLVPVWTPMLMPLRLAATSAVPVWQLVAGAASALAMSVVCVWLSGRIFRVGVLASGKAPKLGQLVRWAFRS
jgi:ABC-2 type transport system permease protein